MFNGAILVGAAERTGGEPFFAVDPSTGAKGDVAFHNASTCLLYTSPSPRDS